MATTTPIRTRQKSCVLCAASKRKCDQGDPCSRCASKSMVCEYKSARRRLQSGVHEEGVSSDPKQITLDDEMLFSEHNETSPTGELYDAVFSASLSSVTESSSPNTNTIFDDSFFHAFDNRGLANTYLEIGVMDRERIRYCVKCLKSYPFSLAHSGKNAFIHPQNYLPTMSRALQDAVSASSLYSAKSSVNEDVVWEIITSKVTQLTEPKPFWSVAEHLACVQSLIIFQIIRLFDGDIKQRSDAEQQEELLTSWTDSLVVRTGMISSTLGVFDRGWEIWAFEEAIRRTVLVSRIAQSMFAIQRQGFCTMVGAVMDISFTAQMRLWTAPSAIHFAEACKHTNPFWVEKMDLEDLLKQGNIEDLDEIAWLMLVTSRGVDGANEWISSKGDSRLID
ncbi:hypothetical protein VTL71DRAFT_12409 [Oculimacula yallundae]|uniref:Zn(2)-C6 fungal-type domain-containing protein n=1 Tax=Oculimacula yallundae TaxID=86028 RepID=A0ABR4CMY6_9HELO